jgi:hypothetical protein
MSPFPHFQTRSAWSCAGAAACETPASACAFGGGQRARTRKQQRRGSSMGGCPMCRWNHAGRVSVLPSAGHKTSRMCSHVKPQVVLLAHMVFRHAFCRQRHDERLRRGCEQKSVVLLSSLPLFGLLEPLARLVGPAALSYGPDVLREVGCSSCASWLVCQSQCLQEPVLPL